MVNGVATCREGLQGAGVAEVELLEVAQLSEPFLGGGYTWAKWDHWGQGMAGGPLRQGVSCQGGIVSEIHMDLLLGDVSLSSHAVTKRCTH